MLPCQPEKAKKSKLNNFGANSTQHKDK